MRCPKCGFHSFDYLDNCKKCGVDLTELKRRFRLQGYFAPPALATAAEAEESATSLPDAAEVEEEAIDFGFDALEEAGAAPPPEFGDNADESGGSLAEAGSNDPAAIDLAADSDLSLDQPFPAESENLPDEGLPKFDDRF